jgi:hypothetical protein
MSPESRVPLGLRAGLVLVGVVVVLAGLFWRSINQEYTTFTVERVVLADGSVAVYEPDAEGDWPQWEVVAGSTDAETIVVRRSSENAEPEPVFTGTSDEAATWAMSRGRTPLFEGTAQAADAWIAEQETAADSTVIPNLLLAVGGGIALLGLGLGWERR